MQTGTIRRINQFLRQWNLKIGTVPVWLLGLAVVVVWFAPFVWMVSTSFKPLSEILSSDINWIPVHPILTNYQIVLQSPIARWTLNSVIVAVVSTAIAVTFASMAGFALGVLNFPGKNVIFFMILASIMIPANMMVVPLFVAFLRLHIINSYPALILPSVVSVISVYIFRQYFMTFPEELIDAATVDGANKITIFFRIALPLAKAPFIAATILLFSGNWNAFFWPLLVTFNENMKTMPVGVAEYASVIGAHTQLQGFGPGMAAVTLLSIPSLLVFFSLQRYFMEGISRTGIKG